MRYLIGALAALLLVGCGGERRIGKRQTLDGAPHEQRLRQGGEGPERPDSKGTWVVNPVNPDGVQWSVTRGGATAQAPLQAGDEVIVKCTHCDTDQIYLTVWSMKAGAIQRVVHVDVEVTPGAEETIYLQPGDEALRVVWARQKLYGAPDDFENLHSFSTPRASPISFSQSGQFIGELHWGPLLPLLAQASGGGIQVAGGAR